jgi:hypothetical protein
VRSQFRVSFVALAVSALVVLSAAAPAVAAPEFGIEKFFAGNCKVPFEECGEGAKEITKEEAEEEGFTQAGGFVPYGVTDFTVKKKEIAAGVFAPVESIKNLRVDVAPGVVTNPQAAGVEKCSMTSFKGIELVPGVFSKSSCSQSTIIGKQEATTVLEVAPKTFADVELEGNVYNLEPTSGQATTYGVALEIPGSGGTEFVHSFIQGSVEYKTDYHDYFVITNLSPGLLASRLVFYGAENPFTKEKTGLLRNTTACVQPGPNTTTTDTAESENGIVRSKSFEDPIGTTGCEGLTFKPTFALTPESSVSDQPDGLTVETTDTHPATGIDTADVKNVSVTMPEGLTMNPSAGAGLAACTPKQAGFGKEERPFKIATLAPSGCPSSAKIGTVGIEVPTLPEGTLQGSMYLGQSENSKGEAEAIGGPPYTIYLDARSARYGLRVLLKGTVTPNTSTGQLTATFNENPQAPYNSVALHFNGGAYAPIANPLACGTGTGSTAFSAYSGATLATSPQFTTAGCSSSPPAFAPTQSTSVSPVTGGTDTGFIFNLTRPAGTQYLEKVRTVLPPGVVGKIPTVPLCGEAEATAGTCSEASMIGTVAVTAGSGEPFPFNGKVYLTGPYQGAPYGLAFVVPVVAGPFNLGKEITRAKIEVEPYSSRVIVSTTLPTIKGGIPVRMRSLSVNVSRPNYLLNPTNCQLEAVESTLTSTLKATANLSTPFQAEGCGTLAFKPSFSAKTTGKTSKANGASLETTINQPAGQANLKSVLVTLPKQLPSRLTTLQKACPEATFAANPLGCPAGSIVGNARANTPTLPGKLVGPAVFVSHGGQAFPDLDLVLEANGIRTIVVGNTKITNGITTTNFAATPDVPVSSVTVSLPTGPNSALGANGNLCVTPLVMPTTITGQNGLQIKQNTKIAVTGCGVQIVGHKAIGNTAYVTVKTFAAGRIGASGSGLLGVSRTLNSASNATTLKVSLTRGSRSRRRPFSTRVRVGFVPKQRKLGSSSATVTVRF